MIELGVLGPLTFHRDGRYRAIPTVMLRRLVALLLARAGAQVSTDVLIDTLWGGAPPPSARRTLTVYVSRLRALMAADDRVEANPGCYALYLHPDELDVYRFVRLVDDARAARERGDHATALAVMGGALALWRGRAFDGLRDMPPVAAEADRLERLRLTAFEEWVDLELDTGQPQRVLDPLDEMIVTHPYQERLPARLMLALYRSGRSADALDTYRRTYRTLADDLGIEPSDELARLFRQILAGDPQLLAGPATRGPNLLPRPVTHFTGRGAQLAALDEIAAAGGTTSPVAIISAITGAAGVGKTALAVHWARAAADRFPDGQLYINLQGHGAGMPLPPLDALLHLLHALGVPSHELPVDQPTAAARYRSLLADRRTLVVLDNAHSVAQVRPLLAAGPACMSIVTSRDRLTGLIAADGAHRVPVDVVSPGEAAELLAAIIGAARVRAEPEATAALAELCGRLPLALRIIAAALADAPTRSIAAHVALLSSGDRLSLLAVDGDPEGSVQAALDHSYHHLDPATRRIFRLLAAAPGDDIGLPAAIALTGADRDRATARLDSLCAGHLLDEHAPGRYRFHDLIREYARQRHRAEDTAHDGDQATRQLLGWYVHATAAAIEPIRRFDEPPMYDIAPVAAPVPQFADVDTGVRWLDTEYPNLLAAVRLAADRGLPGHAVQLAHVLTSYLRRRRPTADVVAVSEIALRAAGHLDDPVHVRAMVKLGYAYCVAGRTAEAIEWLTRAVDRCRAAGERPVEALAHNYLGTTLRTVGAHDDAAEHYRRALDLFVASGDQGRAASTLSNLAVQLHLTGRDAEALAHARRALDLECDIGRGGEAAARTNLGLLLARLGRHPEAVTHGEIAAGLHRTAGSRAGEASTLVNLSLSYRDLGRHQDAVNAARRALTLADDIDVPAMKAEALNTLGEVTLAAGDPTTALRWHHQALQAAASADSTEETIRAQTGIAHIRLHDQVIHGG